jgi:hypothetical protein
MFNGQREKQSRDFAFGKCDRRPQAAEKEFCRSVRGNPGLPKLWKANAGIIH